MALITFLAVVVGGNAVAEPNPLFKGFPLAANDAYYQDDPFAGKGVILWTDDRDYSAGQKGENEVYSYDVFTGNVTRLTHAATYKISPRLDHGLLVWVDGREDNYHIYGLNLSTQELTQLTDYPSNQTSPDLSYPWLVYQDDRLGRQLPQIWAYNIETQASQQLTEDGRWTIMPAVGGNLAAWIDIQGLASVGATQVSKSAVVVKDLSTGEIRYPSGAVASAQESFLDVDDPYVVWQDNRAGNDGWDIFVYDWRTNKERPLVAGPNHQTRPQLSYPHLAWLHTPRGDDAVNEIRYRNLSSSQSIRSIQGPPLNSLNPSIGDGYVAWTNLRPDGGAGGYDLWAARVADVTAPAMPTASLTNSGGEPRVIVDVSETPQGRGIFGVSGPGYAEVMVAFLVVGLLAQGFRTRGKCE